MAMQAEPLVILLELTRAEQAEDPHAFRMSPQDYLLFSAGGGVEQAHLDWDEALLRELLAVR